LGARTAEKGGGGHEAQQPSREERRQVGKMGPIPHKVLVGEG